MNTFHIILTSVISAVLGILTALATTHYKTKKQQRLEKEKEKDQIRLKYLNPLLVASIDYHERMVDIKERRRDEDKKNKLVTWFREIKTNNRANQQLFEYWVNDEGFFAMSTLYVTAVYLFYAGQIRRELPFIELAPGDDKALLIHLSKVRAAIGGKWGIWENIQDSIGAYLGDETHKRVMSYRGFCNMLIDKSEMVWFNRLIDFYRDIDKKTEEHIDKIVTSVQALIYFLNLNMKLKKDE